MLREEPGNAKALYRRGRARRALGQTAEALADLEGARAAAPGDGAIARELAAARRAAREARLGGFGGRAVGFRLGRGVVRGRKVPLVQAGCNLCPPCTRIAALQESQAEGQLFKGFFQKAGEQLYDDDDSEPAQSGSTQQQQQRRRPLQQRGWLAGLVAAAVALLAALLAAPLLRALRQ